MNRGKLILSLLIVLMLLTTSIGFINPSRHQVSAANALSFISTLGIEPLDDEFEFSTFSTSLPSAIEVSDANPFYALIATPLAVHYNLEGQQTVIPLYVRNADSPSSAVDHAITNIGIPVDLVVNDSLSAKETSLFLAEHYWEYSSLALVLKNDTDGYNLGVAATPLASYFGIPVIVTDEIDEEVEVVLNHLGVTVLIVCGNLNPGDYDFFWFDSVEDIVFMCTSVIDSFFNQKVDYITLANPQDIIQPTVLETQSFHFNGTVSSSVALPTQSIRSLINKNTIAIHNITIPASYKYTQLKFDLENLNIADIGSLGDRLYLLLLSPEGYRYVYASTAGGLPDRDSTGNIIRDKLHFEFTIYNKPGVYEFMVLGHFFGSSEGKYDLTVTLDNLSTPVVPLMKNLSSLAPYLTAYHKGIVFADPDFTFAADDTVIFNGSTCPGVTQPGTNPLLLVPSNNHTMHIHNELNDLLAKIAEIPVPITDLSILRNQYADHPINIAITADPTMIPMYFYFNPDGKPTDDAYISGFAIASDYIYGDIDPRPDDVENDTYTYWPFQENIVGRVTGRDVQDCSALIARTIFYNNIINEMGDWKNNGLVQTGCGLEFQNLPLITRLGQILNAGGRGEPTKFPTGESWFINERLKKDMEEGSFTVKSTKWTQSQREGFNQTDLNTMKKFGLLNRLFFPKSTIARLSSTDKVTGGADQLNSNFIFVFAHGSYNLYEFGDILMDSHGIPFISAFARIYPKIGSRLSTKGDFDIRAVENMNYGPSVIFVESCITARTDGYLPETTLSQTYLHAGVNTYIGATRFTADPGYLDPRPLPGGLGFGILGLLNATLRYKLTGEFPDLHFGAVISEEFINNLNANQTTGLALRNAKNAFLPKDANSTFLWSPPLTFSSGNSAFDNEVLLSLQQQSSGNERTRTLDKKYVALHEFVIYGDPAFNPYQPKNNG
ncbi:MAG: C25 family cysteine peptidase [Euryarchaeota archaeon]|nr:C25 family cysteine peptidase [Euryarchaeota archaeon]